MRLSPPLRIGALTAAICFCIQGQTAQSKDPQAEVKGMPPRASVADYQAHAQAGAVTIAAEFNGHAVLTPQGSLSTEDYVAIETGFFGAPGARTTISSTDFSLSINGKKPVPSQPFGLVAGSVKDPLWEPPVPVVSKPKNMVSSDDEGQQQEKRDPNAPKPEVKIPIPVQRGWAQRVLKVALPEGDRPLPQAGMIFFQYRGKIQNIDSLELTYSGPAGKAKLELRP
jgi:hypothetical protein